MGKTWVLDSGTKGTGARMVPLEDVLAKPEVEPGPERRPRRRSPDPGDRPAPARPRQKRREPVETSATALPPGHVRKKATGELGKVRAVDSAAGTVTVQWLKQGRTSTVPLADVSRR
jgi:hypothetical protein